MTDELGHAVPSFRAELGIRLRWIEKTYFQTRADAAEVAAVSKSTLQRWIEGGSDPSFEGLAKLARHTGVSLDWLATGQGESTGKQPKPGLAVEPSVWLPGKVQDAAESGFVMIPRYDVTASAGPGSFRDMEKVTDVLAFKADWVRRELRTSPDKLALITAEGDSMDPTIRPGDILLIDTSVDEIEQDSIYVVVIDGYVMVKRCQRLFRSGIVIKSDNPNYDEIRLGPDEAGEFIVAGRVCWVGRMI
jgi:phage repressor protein C with HTH and peptisase S24 domain